MKTKTKKGLAWLLSLCMIVMLFPVSAWAAEETAESTPEITVEGLTENATTEEKIAEDETGKVSDFNSEGRTPIQVSLKANNTEYSNVRVEVAITEGDSDGIQLLAYDEQGQQWYDIVKSGWGPEGGFPLADAETDVYLVASEPGSYTATIDLVDADDGDTVLATAEASVTAAEAGSETLDYEEYHDFYYDGDNSYSMDQGTSVQFTWNDAPAGEALTWSSTQPGVATVDQDGLVTGEKAGRTFIKAAPETGEPVYFKVTVEAFEPGGPNTRVYTLESIEFSNPSINLFPQGNEGERSGRLSEELRYQYSYTTEGGETGTVTARYPKNGEHAAFSSDHEEVVTVETSTGEAWVEGSGTATVTATMYDRNGDEIQSVEPAEITVNVPDVSQLPFVAYSYDGKFSDPAQTISVQLDTSYFNTESSLSYRSAGEVSQILTDAYDTVYFRVQCEKNKKYYFLADNYSGYSVENPKFDYNSDTGIAVFKVPMAFLKRSSSFHLEVGIGSGDGTDLRWSFSLDNDPSESQKADLSRLPFGVYKHNGNTIEIAKNEDGSASIKYNGVVLDADEPVDSGYGEYWNDGGVDFLIDASGSVRFDGIYVTAVNAAGAHWDTYNPYSIDGFLTYDVSARTLTDDDTGAVYTFGGIDQAAKNAQSAINNLTESSDQETVADVVSQVLALDDSQKADLGTDAIQALEQQLERVTVAPSTTFDPAQGSIDSEDLISEAPTATGLMLAAGVTGAESTPPDVGLEARQLAVPDSLPSTISAGDVVLAFDLTLKNGGTAIHDLAVPVKVTFKLPESLQGASGGNYQILHHKSGGSYELLPLVIEGDYGWFITSSLSTFTVVPSEAELPGGNPPGGNPPGGGSHPSGTATPVATPSAPAFVSDTNADFNVSGTYQFRITSANGAAPSFVVGTADVFLTELVNVSGNGYYFKLTAIGQPGAKAGIYVNGVKLLVATVGATASLVKSDTTAPFKVAKGKTYVFKLTADKQPAFLSGNSSVFQTAFVKAEGKDYFFRVTAVGQPGQAAGFYINSAKTPVAAATIA